MGFMGDYLWGDRIGLWLNIYPGYMYWLVTPKQSCLLDENHSHLEVGGGGKFQGLVYGGKPMPVIIYFSNTYPDYP